MSNDQISNVLLTALKESGIDPTSLKTRIEESIEVDLAVLYANPNKIPDELYQEKKRSMREAKMFCYLLI